MIAISRVDLLSFIMLNFKSLLLKRHVELSCAGAYVQTMVAHAIAQVWSSEGSFVQSGGFQGLNSKIFYDLYSKCKFSEPSALW